MTRLPILVPGFLLLGVLAVSCRSAPEPEDDAAARDPSFLPARMEYRTHCAVCHGRDGRGTPRLFPPLRGSSWVNGTPGIPIRAVLHGVDGRITVEGEEYMNRMAPLGHRLSDEQIARILTYVRASWGNTARAVGSAEVARVRAETEGRRRPWTEAEFLELSEDSTGP